MSELTSKKVLNTALMMEEGSIRLYISAQDKVVNPSSKQFLKELVLEEQRHKKKILEAMRDPDKIEEIGSSDREIQDLKIIDILKDVSLSPEADYQQILIYAGKREKDAHDLYSYLAKRFKTEQIGQMFKRLAQEELKHKLRLEKEYDDIILTEM